MNRELFEKLIKEDEGNTLDFKEYFYDFSGSTKIEKEQKQCSFIKDFLAFTNTIRERSAFIIIGVKDGTKELIGMDRLHDGNEIATVLEGRLDKIPEYHYENFKYDEKIYGIIEIPIKGYGMPCRAIRDIGSKVKRNITYIRRDQSSSEATREEEQDIIEWFKGLKRKKRHTNIIYLSILSIVIFISVLATIQISKNKNQENINNQPAFNQNDNYTKILLLPFQQLGSEGNDYAGLIKEYLDNLIKQDNIYIRTYYLNTQAPSPNFDNDSALTIIKQNNADILIWGKFISENNAPDKIKIIFFTNEYWGKHEFKENFIEVSASVVLEGKPIEELEYLIYEQYARELFVGAQKLKKLQIQGYYFPEDTIVSLFATPELQIEISQKFLKHIINKYPNKNKLSYDLLGLTYAEQNKYDSAIIYYNEALKQDLEQGHHAEIYTNLGTAYWITNKIEQAKLAFSKSISLNPNQLEAYNNRSQLYLFNGQIDSGIYDCSKTIELNPNSIAAYQNRGYAYLIKKEYKLAVNDFKSSLNIDANNIKSIYLLGLSYYLDGDTIEANKYYEISMKLDPVNTKPYKYQKLN